VDRGDAVAAADQILSPAPGLYALVLYLGCAREITVGALGRRRFPAGHYVYVGSAWGSGGLAARVRRHLRGDGRLHWHVDYLRAQAKPTALWWAERAQDECSWAQALMAYPEAEVVVPRFGASDCTCAAHLAYVGESAPPPDLFPAVHVNLHAFERGLS